MSTPAENVKDLLVTAGVGVFAASTGWCLLIDRDSEARAGQIPDTTIVVRDTGGFDPMLITTGTIYRPTVQLLLRGAQNGEAAAKAKARETWDALIGLPKTTVDGNVVVGIWGMGDVAYLGHDSQNRPRHSMNIRLAWEPS